MSGDAVEVWEGMERKPWAILSPFVRKALQMIVQEPWKITSEFLVVPVPADTPILGSVPLLYLGKGNVAVCHGGVQTALLAALHRGGDLARACVWVLAVGA